MNPLIELAKPLVNKGFDVRFITGSRKIGLLKDLGFNAIPISLEDPEAMERIANTTNPVENNPFLLLRQLRQNLMILPKIKEDIRKLLKENKTDIVVADFVAIPAGIVCQENKIPWITTIPTPFAIETLSGTPSYMGGWALSKSFRTKVRDAVGRTIIRGFKRSVEYLCKKEFKELNFKVYTPDGRENAYSPQSILGLGMKEFEFPRDWPEQFRFIGPCCLSPEPLIGLNIPFEDYKRKVLVTLGTHLEWAKMKLIDDLKILAQDFKDVIFVVSFGRSKNNSREPVFKADNIIAYEYIPYDLYLNQFDGVIHHGGAGITYNCIKFLKPSIVIPHDYDQFDFAARIEHNKLGVRSKHLCSKQTTLGLKKILCDDFSEGLRRMNEHMQYYKAEEELEKEIFRLLNI